MQINGIVGKFDSLGRTVIPIELRRKLGSEFEIVADGDSVILRKITDKCEFCGAAENLNELNGKFICDDCVAKLK